MSGETRLDPERANSKSRRRVENILACVGQMPRSSVRKYQVRGYYEYNQLSAILAEKGVKHALEISDTLTMRKLKEVEVYVNEDRPQHQYAVYKNEPVKCMYIKVWRQ
jgi:hypothetical protein